jgi:hypothetical protein
LRRRNVHHESQPGEEFKAYFGSDCEGECRRECDNKIRREEKPRRSTEEGRCKEYKSTSVAEEAGVQLSTQYLHPCMAHIMIIIKI